LTFKWFVSSGNPVGTDGRFHPLDQLDVMINRLGTNRIGNG
jgi:hypothetical protein